MGTPIDHLPAFALDPTRPIAARFAARGRQTFADAARHVWQLPYGRTSDRTDALLVLSEGRGTCSSKHALLAMLAREHGQHVDLMLGIYLMDEANTPGVGPVLAEHGLEAIPEAHCYLRAGGERVDLTHPPSRPPATPIAGFLHEEVITPEQVGAYKAECHKRFLETWPHATLLSSAELWAVREACITRLGE